MKPAVQEWLEFAKTDLKQISDFSFVFTPRKPVFTRLGAISQNNLTQLSAK
jgi:hypothetical protein